MGLNLHTKAPGDNDFFIRIGLGVIRYDPSHLLGIGAGMDKQTACFQSPLIGWT